MKDSLIQHLILTTSKELGVNIIDKRRTESHVLGRFIVYTLLRKHFGYTYQQIAKVFDLKSHATVMHGIKELPYVMKYNMNVAKKMENICEDWRKFSEQEGLFINSQGIKHLEDKINLLNLEIEVLQAQLNKLKKVNKS
jgi:uncharacterized small protein (DUF1192 family)